MKNLGLDGVKEMEDFKAPEAGGYIGIIKNVFDNTDKGQLEIELDIAEGEYANYYEQLMAAKGFWGLKAYKNYENKKDPSKDEYCKRYFKSFITAVENSNEGYNFVNTDYNEKTLIGKKVGIILYKEQYIANDGSTKVGTKFSDFKTIEKIKSGDFKVPEFKELAQTNTHAEEEEDFNLPF